MATIIIQEDILVDLFQQDREKAIPLIYDKYSAALYGIILRIIKEEELAQEVLQDTFVRIWNKSSYYNPQKGRLFTWMMNIARNIAINTLNSKAVKDKSRIQGLDNNVYNIKSSYNTKEEVVDICDILQRLDQKYKTIIELAYFEGFTQKEISEKLDIPLGTVKSSVKIAMRKLKSIYSGKSNLYGLVLFLISMINFL